MLRAAVDFAAQLLWPARCAGCDQLVPSDLSFCEACAPSVVRLGAVCPRCALPAGQAAHGACALAETPFSAAAAAFAYGGAVTEALLRLKYGGRSDVARPLGRCLAAALGDQDWVADAWLPVPLHPRRLRLRGFNQALELARAARSFATGAPPLWVDVLRRVRDTPGMGRGTVAERRALVAGAFGVSRPARVRGRRLLVVDDVMTTGATLAGCAQTLREAGAADVRVLVLARALPPSATMTSVAGISA